MEEDNLEYNEDLGFPGPAREVLLPASDVPQAESYFDGEEEPTEEVDLFEGVADESFAPPAAERPIASTMLALSKGAWKNHPTLALAEENIDLAQQVLDSGGEFYERVNIARNQAARTLQSIGKIREQLKSVAGGSPIDPEWEKAYDKVYADTLTANLDAKAQTALELDTVQTVQDLLTSGDTVEAAVMWDLYSNGDAQKVMQDNAVKNLIMAQRIEELESEYRDSSWPRAIYNFMSQFVPLKGNFDRSGIMDDAKVENNATSFLNFFLSGENLQKQGEALYNLSVDDFAKAMRRNGPVVTAIKNNAGLFVDDPGLSADILQKLSFIDDNEKAFENAFGIIDPLTVVPWTKVGSVPKALTRMGARKAATMRVADAFETLVKEGAPAAKKKTAMSEAVIMAEVEPRAFSTINKVDGIVDLSGDVNIALDAARKLQDELPRFISPSRFDDPNELAAAYEDAQKAITEQFGERIRDVEFRFENVQTGKTSKFGGVIPEQGNLVNYVEVTFGKKGGGGYAKEGTASAAMNTSGYKGDVFQDKSGQWFWKSRFNIREDGFITAPLNTPAATMVGRVLRSNARLTDESLMSKGIQAGNNANKVREAFNTRLKEALKGINSDDKLWLDQIIRKGQNQERWLNEEEFTNIWDRATGRMPTAKAWEAYSQYRLFNDVDWHIRNDAMYMNKARMGAETVEFHIGKTPSAFKVDGDAIIDTDPTKKPLREIWDASEGRYLDSPSAETIKQMSGEGYVLVQMMDDVRLPNKEVVRSFMIKNSDLRRGPLNRKQIPYTSGGHREYVGNYFVKQTMRDGKKRLVNPNTWITGNNKNELADWTEAMNKARLAVKEGRDAQWLDDNVFLGRKGFTTGKEFLEDVSKDNIDLDEAFEITRDREMPLPYQNQRDDVLNFVDMDETSVNSYFKTRNRMYYSSKGDQLRDAYGELAETVDPWETLNRALNNITRNYSLNNYKINALERFKNTYGGYLELKNVDTVDSLYNLVTAKIRDNVTDPNVITRIKQEQAAISHVLRFETGFEKTLRQATANTAEWVLGTAKSGPRVMGHDFVYLLRESKPIEALRSFAFDAKLGLFNWGQFIIQSSTTLAATALNPRYGFKGIFTAGPIFTWKTMAKNKTAMEQFMKNGIWKPAGFDSPEEFVSFANMLDDTGLLNLDSTHALIDSYGANKVFGATSKLQSAREAGRFFFYSAEKFNRIVAARIAYGEAKDAGLKLGTAKFREAFLRLTDDYSFNMMSESSARFQNGLVSIPTQFWAYSFRMMDAMIGNRFTPKQKLSLILSQFVLAGSAGIPLGEQLSSFYQEWTGQPVDIRTAEGTIDRGLVDKAIYELVGADVRAGEKIGTAGLISNVVKDIFGMGEYGEKSLAEMVGGVTGSMVSTIGPSLWDVMKYAAAESGGETGYPLTGDTLTKLASEVSTFSNTAKALSVYNYGQYLTKKGMVQASGIPSEAAFFIAAGLRPQAIETMSEEQDLLEAQSKAVKEIATKVENWRQEAFTNPDKYQENLEKVNSLLGMTDPYTRQLVLKRVNEVTDASLADKIGRKFEEEQLEREIVNGPTN